MFSKISGKTIDRLPLLWLWDWLYRE